MVDPRIDLAIGIGPCPALSEEKIGFWVEGAVAEKSSDGTTAIRQSGPPIEEVHPNATPGQRQRGKKTRWTRSDDRQSTRPVP